MLFPLEVSEEAFHDEFFPIITSQLIHIGEKTNRLGCQDPLSVIILDAKDDNGRVP